MSITWPMVRLGDVLTERQETPLPEEMVSGRIKIVNKISFDTGQIYIRPIGETRTGMILIRPGDLVVSGINAAKGAIAIHGLDNTCPIAATIHYGAYIPDSNRTSTKFLWWILRSRFFRDLLSTHLPGGIKMELKAKRLLPIPIPLPPLEEQRRVVTRIEELSAQLEEAHNLRQQAMVEISSTVFSACETMLREVGKRFINETLETLVDQSRGISYGIVQTGDDVENGIPTLRAGDMAWFSVNTTNVKRVLPEIEKSYQRTRLRGGELLLRIRGGFGELAVCPPALRGGNVSREIAVIPLREHVDPFYGMYVLAAPSIQTRIAGHVRGTSYIGINLKDVRTLPLPVPPLPEQRRITSQLHELQRQLIAVKSLQAETVTELDALLPSILDRAFKGEL